MKMAQTLMRKTSRYFKVNLTLLHRTNALDRLSLQLDKDRQDSNLQRKGRLYYHYDSYKQIEQRMRVCVCVTCLPGGRTYYRTKSGSQ